MLLLPRCRIRSFRGRVAAVLVMLVIVTYLFIYLFHGTTEDRSFFRENLDLPGQIGRHPILLWWTPFTSEHGSHRKCGNQICFFTENRKYIDNEFTMAIMFYGSDFKPTDLPLPRLPLHDWALLHEESPKNNYLFSTKKVMEMFNHTATFRRTSDLPLTLQYLDNLGSIVNKKYFVPTKEKNFQLKHRAPVIYVHSDCDTPSERDSYVKELMKYIKIDSYGKCLHNKNFPPNFTDGGMTSMNSDDFLNLVSQYKFSLAFENALCDDYITEKLWRPLTVGSVPIYYGSSTVQDWLPNAKSAILVTQFATPKKLANYLHYLLGNDTAYEYHLEHKIHARIKNSMLLQAMESRKWGINNDLKQGSFIDHFECMVCGRVSRNFMRNRNHLPLVKYRARYNHYGCPAPVSPLTHEPDSHSWWLELYNKGHQEAEALDRLINVKRNFSANEFYREVIRLLESAAIT